jgi:DnaK suppressor protein
MTLNIDELKSELEAKRDELAGRLRKLDDLTVERVADPIGEIEVRTERDAAAVLLERDSRLLREIRAALRRIENGEYGQCQLCGGQIGFRRLRAVPWAGCCVACQEDIN